MRAVFVFVVAVILFGLSVETVHAANVNLSWKSNREQNLAGYKLYIGTSSGSYQSVVVLGKTPYINLNNLLPNKRYYFALTAFNTSGMESSRSNEVHATARLSSDEIDSDDDGISDDREREFGTDPFNSDTDGDGVGDGQELIDGTDPLDRGSVKVALGKAICSEWNGYFSNLWNILEVANNSSKPVTVGVSVYDSNGNGVNRSEVVVQGSSQVDVLVHDLAGFSRDAYGLVCLNHNAPVGTIDGRMVYYKGQPQPFVGELNFQFAFAMPFSPGKIGQQVVPFNTFNPSFNPVDASNPVANWIQLTNLSQERVFGEMEFFGMQGERIGSQAVDISPMQRIDLSAHQFGANQIGMVVWNPRNTTLPVQMRNVRYVYDNPYYFDSFSGAFQLEAFQGSISDLVAPFDTQQEISVAEIFNSSNQWSSVKASFYSGSTNIHNLEFMLAPYASRHIVLNELLGVGLQGVVKLRSQAGGEIGGVVMHYRVNEAGALDYTYGLAARPIIGGVSRGSYNTFLGQDSELVVINTSGSARTANVTLESTIGLRSKQVVQQSVSGMDLAKLKINNYEPANRYGTVSVSGGGEAKFVSWVLRRREGQYAIPTPVR